MEKPTINPPPPDTQANPATADPVARLQDILRRARAGDRTILPELESLLHANPDFWEKSGDLVRAVEQLWIDKIGQKDLVFAQSLRHHVERWKLDLADSGANPLERLLAARIVANWLASQHADLVEAASDDSHRQTAEVSIKRAESANRRLLASIKALATVRRLVGGLKIEIKHSTSEPETAAASGLPRGNPSRMPSTAGPAASTPGEVRGRLDALFSANLMPEEKAAVGAPR